MPPTSRTINGVIYRYKKTGAIPTPEELERLANDIHRTRNNLAYAEQQFERAASELDRRRHEVEACREQHDRAQCFLLERVDGWEMVEVPAPADSEKSGGKEGR